MRALVSTLALIGLALAGCTGDDDDNNEDGPTGAYPCDNPADWPETLESALYPFTVHYEVVGDAAMAAEVVGLLNTSWAVEFGTLGFEEPPSDSGACGEDDRFDVFLWRGEEECYVDIFAEVPETTWADYVAYMVVDPWGPYGGPILDSTLAHELNHAAQAGYDWDEPLSIFEMTATFMEDVVFDEDNEYRDLLADFQRYPDWSIDSSDSPNKGDGNYFLYGASLYLFYVRDRHFPGDASFTVDSGTSRGARRARRTSLTSRTRSTRSCRRSRRCRSTIPSPSSRAGAGTPASATTARTSRRARSFRRTRSSRFRSRPPAPSPRSRRSR